MGRIFIKQFINTMKIKVKQIYVLKKISAENGTYTYQKAIISANQIMTLTELKERQKQAAIDFGVHQNKIGGIYESLE